MLQISFYDRLVRVGNLILSISAKSFVKDRDGNYRDIENDFFNLVIESKKLSYFSEKTIKEIENLSFEIMMEGGEEVFIFSSRVPSNVTHFPIHLKEKVDRSLIMQAFFKTKEGAVITNLTKEIQSLVEQGRYADADIIAKAYKGERFLTKLICEKIENRSS